MELEKADDRMVVVHRLTWRGWFPVWVEAPDRHAAIARAIERQPACIPPGTELHYGPVHGGLPDAKADG